MFRPIARSLAVLALVTSVSCGDDDESPFPGIETADLITDGELVPLAGASDSYKLYRIVVPTGATQLRITTSGGSGDPDIYVSREAAPTTEDADQFSNDVGTDEEIVIASPGAGNWYILVHGFPPTAFSGVTMVADVTP